MVDINWVCVGVGFVIGVACSWFVCDLVESKKTEKTK